MKPDISNQTTWDPRIQELAKWIGKINPRSLDFARSLYRQYFERGSLSDRQWPYVVSLVEEAKKKEQQDMERKVELPPNVDFDFQPIFLLMNDVPNARIRLKTQQGVKVVLRWGSEQYNNANKVVVMATQDNFNRVPAGTIDALGRLRLNQSVAVIGLVDLLKELATNPQETAAKYGKETGVCCFCAITLTDPRSVTVGYGPICAGNYGLPWGEFTSKTDMAAAAQLEKEIFEETEH